MTDRLTTTNLMMKALVERSGGLVAVESILAARWGKASAGTISKKLHGHLDWTIADAIALQDAAGDSPIWDYLAGGTAQAVKVDGCLVAATAKSVRETSEAHEAALAAAMSTDPDAKAKAVKEARESLAATQALLSRLEAE